YETRVEYDLAESGIHPLTTAELLAFDAEPDRRAHELLNLPLTYSEARGTHELRARLAATYRDVTADDVLVTTGAIEANYVLFNALLLPGDRVVSVYPAYQQLYTVPEAIGCAVARLELREENRYHYDLDELERLVNAQTRMIVVNSPHNPTGAAMTAAECARVYALAESVGAYILADEAYRWLTVDDVPLPPPFRDLGPRAISVGTVSKPFGIPGIRLGWIAATEEIAARCWAYRDYTSLSPGGLSDYLACRTFANREAILARTHAISTENLHTLRAFIAERGDLFSWVEPRGGLLGLLRYHLDLPSETVANRLAEEESVMLAPGSAFGMEGRLRIGLGTRPDRFIAGLERVDRFFARLRDEVSRDALRGIGGGVR
ncbi:MAG: aminotransferase class I/II-fold pyridoxal phosphate-dependent enzyme, partial [Thermomicrobiales bacterium]